MKDCWPFGVALRGEASSRPLPAFKLKDLLNMSRGWGLGYMPGLPVLYDVDWRSWSDLPESPWRGGRAFQTTYRGPWLERTVVLNGVGKKAGGSDRVRCGPER